MEKSEIDKSHDLLKKLSKAIDLCTETLLKHTELKELKDEILANYNSSSDMFRDSIWGRKIYKITQSGAFIYTTTPGVGSGSFFGMSEARWLPELKEVLTDFIKKNNKIKKRFDNDEFWLQSNTQAGYEHIMIGDRQDNDKSHFIVGHEAGDIRIDPKDRSPHDLVKNIKTVITRKSGGHIEITESKISFTKKDISEEEKSINQEDKFQRARYL